MKSNWIEENCNICKGQMIGSPYEGAGYCPRCGMYEPAHAPWAGQNWHGVWVSERCLYCYQPIIDTPDPNVNYCPYCGRYQADEIGY